MRFHTWKQTHRRNTPKNILSIQPHVILLTVSLQSRIGGGDSRVTPCRGKYDTVWGLQDRQPAIAENAMDLAYCTQIIIHVLQHVIGDYEVKRTITEGHRLDVDSHHIAACRILIALDVLQRPHPCNHFRQASLWSEMQDS